MPTKTITLEPHEADQAGTLRAVWRPVEPEPDVQLIQCKADPECWVDPQDLYEEWRCPLGNPRDVLVLEWVEIYERENGFGRPITSTQPNQVMRTVASVDVRRVSEMTEDEAVAWGCEAIQVKECKMSAVDEAFDIWHARWPGAQWAWVVGLENVR